MNLFVFWWPIQHPELLTGQVGSRQPQQGCPTCRAEDSDLPRKGVVQILGWAAAIRRAFHGANPSHRRIPQQVVSAGSVFAPRNDHSHPDLLKRLATICLQQLSTALLPVRLPCARDHAAKRPCAGVTETASQKVDRGNARDWRRTNAAAAGRHVEISCFRYDK